MNCKVLRGPWQEPAAKRYLLEHFGLIPRDEIYGRQHSGWKGGSYDGPTYKQAFWFKPMYGVLFMEIWLKYLHQVAKIDRPHPFAFINLRRDPVGEMYKLQQFNKAHKDACGRIGLQVAKPLGTTPHGHRHAYGRRLAAANVSKENIQRLMHHSSIESQEVYTQATILELQTALVQANARMDSTKQQETPNGDSRLEKTS